MDCSTPGLPVHHQLPEFTQTPVHWVGDDLQPSHPLSSPSPPTFSLSQHQGFFKWVLRIRWPKYWSFSFSIRPSNEYSGLISFRMDWLDLLAVQGTLKSLLQHHSVKASILQRSAFLIVQLSGLGLIYFNPWELKAFLYTRGRISSEAVHVMCTGTVLKRAYHLFDCKKLFLYVLAGQILICWKVVCSSFSFQ